MLEVDRHLPARGEAMAEPPVTFAAPLRHLRTQSRLAQEELAEATSLSPLSISDLEHLRRDNTMITTNTAAASAKYYHTRARTGTMARIGSGVSGAEA
jgi:transcriptional regulator with XRE-family HTH domain